MCDVLEGYGGPLGLINGSFAGNSSIVARNRKPQSRVSRAAKSGTVDIASKVSDVASFFKNKVLPGCKLKSTLLCATFTSVLLLTSLESAIEGSDTTSMLPTTTRTRLLALASAT